MQLSRNEQELQHLRGDHSFIKVSRSMIDEDNAGNSVLLDRSNFNLVDTPQDKSVIGFYNNNKYRNGNTTPNRDESQSNGQSKLQKMLINTKFQIDKQMATQVKINDQMHASLLGVNYADQEGFKFAFSRLLWLTYRKGFAPLLVEKNKVPKLTSDAGWGCVIRCTQMLVANCLARIYLRPELSDSLRLKYEVGILNLFNDDVRNKAKSAFSIQNVVEAGLNEHGQMPGEWYGVWRMNSIIEMLSDKYSFSQHLNDLTGDP